MAPFLFRQGRMEGLDREAREIYTAPALDAGWHLYALHGLVHTFFNTLARLLVRRVRPQVKLH